ncbi:MAG: hypothetical protein COW19_00355 [Zetaproteobacteria bacterium CG12_big_fil_rev_8_21_14_0_65_55_1124]|nr:MAG: hypothetical protein AUJ58_01085 [Zetaproteobacteria bacterium CG1_02_55_237]PIS18779.1 MAG: hypothetical protein COT53_08895 [Zetaproteobacteria bacterium CG08_land_8_20_14_0_20_55_17]PIW43896.1 MAG: hypothetical protein COW19_00355 [Zetaproteobacteria bacterium CG12_big_fil_rev_8_21_14_0_65_55_1124]PIY54460.1 MAG: hypothetical protein COZ01_00050 [Zetaproteobacteria bacterium CG_4_10_14_0_8_um_filter_55_43]PIZ38214.1 MAG: hypothetical protein COY36_06640 [Zetaproteobacteria bacterium 
MPRCIAVYISGHGYGHLAQIAPVLNQLPRLCPDVTLLLRTALPTELLSRRIHVPFTLLAGAVDVGVVQKDAISEDIPATIVAAHAFYDAFTDQIEHEVERLSPYNPIAIFSDIAPVAFPAAKQLGIPSFAIASLDWHDIYRDFLPADDPLLSTLQQAHTDCDLLIQPPLSMPMNTFPNRRQVAVIVDPLPATVPVKATSASEEKTALIMFGGAGDPPFDINALGNIPDWRFLTLSPVHHSAPANIRQASLKNGTAAVMQDCDIVITKPGYGTLAECWQTGTPLVYLPRKFFSEYPYLDAWLQEFAPSARLSVEDFVSGNWLPAMQQALDCPRTYPHIPASGAEQAAALIAQALPRP